MTVTMEFDLGERSEIELLRGSIDDSLEQLQRARRSQQLLEHELGVERLVPGTDAARYRPAHGQGAGEPVRVALNQAGGDQAAEGMPPRDSPAGMPDQAAERVKGGDLVGQPVLDRPAGRRVGGAGQRVPVI